MLEGKKKSYRLVPVNFLYQNEQSVPVIKLQGKWLQKFGFQPGDTLLVDRQPNLLVIRPLFNENLPDSFTSLNS